MNILRSEKWIAIYESLWIKDGRRPVYELHTRREPTIAGQKNRWRKFLHEELRGRHTPFSTWLHRSGTPAGWWSLSRLHHDALTEPLFPRWLFALCKTEIERANGFRPILVERPIKKVRRPAFSAEEARIKVRKLPLLIGSLIGPHEPWHESSLR